LALNNDKALVEQLRFFSGVKIGIQSTQPFVGQTNSAVFGGNGFGIEVKNWPFIDGQR
jgi:hypothetical protein